MAKIYSDVTSLKADLQHNPKQLPDAMIDDLAYTANLSPNQQVKEVAQQAIRDYSKKHGAYSASIHDFYMARGKEKFHGFSVPAFNIRALTYDTAQVIFSVMTKHSIGPAIFEIALSEQGYTHQPPAEYSAAILAAAMKTGYKGPVFMQGDHYQLHSKEFKNDKETELRRMEDHIRESIKAEFYNIDIDGSTLVNLEPADLSIQQKDNFEVTAHFTRLIRKLQPEGVTISIGGEIGHIGGVNSTPEDFVAFMDGYLKNIDPHMTGISKVSIQTGTSHGGIPKADGSLEPVDLEAELHKTIGAIARKKYGLGGTVQHGASTLPVDSFHLFPENGALEVHLATQWQNIVYDAMNEQRKMTLYNWVHEHLSSEKEDSWTDDQFIYKLRKKAFGEFKDDLWTMNIEEKFPILQKLEDNINAVCEKLNVHNTRVLLDEYIS